MDYPIHTVWGGIPKSARSRPGHRPPASTGLNGVALNAINEKLSARNLTLHPTKGYRKLHPNRLAAAIVTQEIRQGYVSPLNPKKIRRAMRNYGATIAEPRSK